MTKQIIDAMLDEIKVPRESIKIPDSVVDIINGMGVDYSGRVFDPHDIYESLEKVTDVINMLANDQDFHYQLQLPDSNEITFYVFLSIWREALVRGLKETMPNDTLRTIQ